MFNDLELITILVELIDYVTWGFERFVFTKQAT